MPDVIDRLMQWSEKSQRTNRGVKVLCPCHEDVNPSLHVYVHNGRVVLKCHAGCSAAEVSVALVNRGIVSEEELLSRNDGRRSEETIYSYCDEAGNELFQVVKRAGKRFVQRMRGPAGWEYRVRDARKVLYRLPEIVKTAGAPVYVFEGEKDVETARRLGLKPSTCNPGGAGKWKFEYSAVLAGRVVYVVPDNDNAGWDHAENVCESLMAAGAKPRLVRLPLEEDRGDFSDWIAQGGTRDEFLKLCSVAAPFAMDSELEVISLSEVDETEVKWLWMGRIPYGKVTMLAGDPNLGKSFITMDIAARVSTGAGWPDLSGLGEQQRVLILNAEDDASDTLVPRLKGLGADLSRIDIVQGIRRSSEVDRSPGSAKLTDRQFSRAFSLSRDLNRLAALLRGSDEYGLVVIDPISAYMDGMDSNSNTEVRKMLRELQTVVEGRRTAILVVSHLRKRGGKTIYRTIGSLAFTAAARACWLVARHPQHDKRRLLLPVKINIACDPSGVDYEIVEGRVEWGDEPLPGDAEAILERLSSG